MEKEPGALDPIALTLAVWLAVIVGVTGLARLAAAPPEFARPDRQAVARAPVNDGLTMVPMILAIGG